jgi:DNA helicase-2/ATP-dependent DNA helicase PcrA
VISIDLAYGRLSPEQREAVLFDANCVVLAGPGSGKTDTIVLKASHLLGNVIPPTRGVAVLTFNNDTVREVSERLRRFGHHRSRRLMCTTMHGFALNSVIRTFGPLLDARELSLEVLDPATERNEWLAVFDSVGLVEDPDWNLERRIRARRALALGEDVSYEDDRLIKACEAFDHSLVARGQIDFEGMILRAYSILRSNQDLLQILVQRYPWLLIDEYQDLGIVLHRLVLLLAENGMNVFAVGDPDQSIYGFTGSEPRLMHELYQQEGFRRIDLGFNYRSGSRIVFASMAALGEERELQADPESTEPGLVELIDVPGGIAEQAKQVAEVVVPRLLQSGVRAEEVAILYPSRGQVPTSLKQALEHASVPYVAERDTRFVGGQVGRWLQRCARRAVDPDSADAEPLTILLADLQRWLPPGSNIHGMPGLRVIWRLVRRASLDGARIGDWIRRIEDELALSATLESTDGAEDAPDYDELLRSLDDPAIASTRVVDYAEGARVAGKVVLTTYHSSKGRQFDVVILPGLQDQLMPRMRWDPSARQMRISSRELQEQRRLFYVGFTRARHQVILVSSASAANDRGYYMPRSRFVDEIGGRLA